MDHLVLIHKDTDDTPRWRVRCSCGFDEHCSSVQEACDAAGDHHAPDGWATLAERCARLMRVPDELPFPLSA